MRFLLRPVTWLAVASIAVAAPVNAAPEVDVPKNDGWVTDLAGMLSSNEEQELELLMESYKQGSAHEIALLTVPDLGGETMERYALEVGRAWSIGGAEKNNGAILVVAQEERALRIEVGRGLEGDLPDAICARILDDVVTPEFKRGDFAGGISAGVRAMHAAIGGDYGPIERSRSHRRSSGGIAGVFFIVFVIMALTRGRRRGGFGSVLPWILLNSAMSSGHRGSWGGGGGFSSGGGGGGFSGFGGGGGFSGGGASGGW